MRAIKRIFESVKEKRESLTTNKRIVLDFSNRRDVWNSRRRFSY